MTAKVDASPWRDSCQRDAEGKVLIDAYYTSFYKDRPGLDLMVYPEFCPAGLPAEAHLHCCHSVYKRQSDVVGDYKPILPRLADVRVDRVNLEFAYPNTGDVSDLALLPAGVDVEIKL